MDACKRACGTWRRVVVALALGACFFGARGQTSAYTVQVVAVSSQERALGLVSDLTRQGYPAYLLTVPTPQGLVYRIRVGAFANRAAAARYAGALPAVGDSRPTPALAENIPAGVSPLEPALLGAYAAAAVDLQVLPWGDRVALRVQQGRGAQAAYILPDGTAAPPEFVAWRAAPQPDGAVVRVYSLPLWPEDGLAASAPERTRYRQTVLANLAAQFELSVDALEGFVFTPADAAPFLVLAERFDPRSGFKERLQALGRPGTATPDGGPELYALPGTELPDFSTVPLFELPPSEPSPAASAPQVRQGDGWQAVAAGRYSELAAAAATKPWRAVVGTPLWAGGDVLITVDGPDLLVYSLLER